LLAVFGLEDVGSNSVSCIDKTLLIAGCMFDWDFAFPLKDALLTTCCFGVGALKFVVELELGVSPRLATAGACCDEESNGSCS
jgi:hypothetical protein